MSEYSSVIICYFYVKNAVTFASFIKSVFHAKELSVSYSPKGVILHARMQIGISYIELSEVPSYFKPTRCTIRIIVHDVQEVYEKALKEGAKGVIPPHDFGSDQRAIITDGFGNTWYISSAIDEYPFFPDNSAFVNDSEL